MIYKDLYVLQEKLAQFNDYSDDMQDYLRDEVAITYVALEDSFYIGLYKPFDTSFVELDIASLIPNTLSATINGNAIKLKDDTKAFTRSGFIKWDKPSDWTPEVIDGVEAFWIKLNFTNDFDATLKGINLVFSDDNDLSQEISNLDKMLAKGDSSFIRFHVASRNEIIQTIRNGGMIKEVPQDNGADKYENITKWDILDVGEINQASIYLTLSKIYFDISVNPDDKAYLRFRDYQGMFGKAFALFYKKLDLNDDGKYEQKDDFILNNIEINIV